MTSLQKPIAKLIIEKIETSFIMTFLLTNNRILTKDFADTKFK